MSKETEFEKMWQVYATAYRSLENYVTGDLVLAGLLQYGIQKLHAEAVSNTISGLIARNNECLSQIKTLRQFQPEILSSIQLIREKLNSIMGESLKLSPTMEQKLSELNLSEN